MMLDDIGTSQKKLPKNVDSLTLEQANSQNLSVLRGLSNDRLIVELHRA